MPSTVYLSAAIKRQTSRRGYFLLYWPAYWRTLCLLMLVFAGQGLAMYDVCYDGDTDIYTACQPSVSDMIWYQAFKVTVDPATATCGTPASTFRELGDRTNTIYTCDASSSTLRHPPSYMVDDSSDTWWQSINQPSGANELKINITFSFNKTYRMAGDMIFTFRYGRPEKMILEKSVDYGATWTPLQFYARNCGDFQGQYQPGAAVTVDTPTAVICTNQYIETTTRPSRVGQVKFLNDNRFNLFLGPQLVDYESFYTALETKMLDFLLFTDLRIRLIQPATDGRDGLHYSLSDIQAAARCFCNLHAAYCNYTGTDVICDCEHNTMGKSCDACLPLYNERPWMRGSYLPHGTDARVGTGTANECIKCECNDHALSCTYNATYGRGICKDCIHNTRGYHCELCIPTYYPNISLPLSDLNRCIECDCELLGVMNNSLVCAQTESPGVSIGQCVCRALVTGRRCDRCVPGYYGLLTGPSPGNCTACGCNLDGTQGQSNTCVEESGQCPCKVSTQGRICDTCADGYFAFPSGNPQRECLTCDCDKGGSLGSLCDKEMGLCTCRTNITGDKCNRADPGYFVPALDTLTFEPQPGACQVTSDLYTTAAPFDGRSFAVCDLSAGDVSVGFAAVKGAMIQKALQWPYVVAVRHTANSSDITGTLSVQVTGDTTEDLSALSTSLGIIIAPGCPLPTGPSAQVALTFSPGIATAALARPDNLTLDARCQYSMTLELTRTVAPDTGGVNTTSNSTSSGSGRKRRAAGVGPESIKVDSLVLLPALSNADGSVGFQVYLTADNQTVTQASYLSCLQQMAALASRQTAMEQSPCKDLFFSVAAELYDGASACDCDPTGSDPTVSSCQSLGGQCPCKPGVSGRTCDVCTAGYFNLTVNGCSPCNCHLQGAEHGSCDYTTGQCLCRANIVMLTDNITATTTVNSDNTTTTTPIVDGAGRTIVVDGTCSFCRPNFYGINSGQGCAQCECNRQGSTGLQCDESGQCPCKDSVTGLKCNVCRDGFYGFGPQGCSACNCSVAGSTSPYCNQTTGNCACKHNVEGAKCDSCKAAHFNLAGYNPDGCQPCFCYGHGVSCASAPGFQTKVLQAMSPSTPQQHAPLLGDRHTSYGRTVTLWLSATFMLDLHNETLVTLRGNDKSLYHMGRNGTVISPGETLEYETLILESDWMMDTGDQSVAPSALDVMGILANLTEVSQITRSKGQAITVTYLALESAELKTASGGRVATPDVMFVEKCVCENTSHVGGLSCERCATGFRRENTTDISSYDSCVACDCRGRGVTDPPECDEMTGVCLNCRNGTTGDHCELCASFVTGVECDTCESQYWGLQADGCRACNCSSPGSRSPVCDPDSGQCQCAEHVVGRTCDECEENFHGLTATGCVECDSCYSLMKTEILPLRELRDSITSNISLLERGDMNDELGPFTTRLKAAVDQTEILINFLASAEQSESQVSSQILSLNATLVSIQSRMSQIELNSSVEIEKVLAEVESLINRAQASRTSMENSVKTAYNNFNTLQASGTTLSELAASLRSVQNYLQSLADASTTDQEILDDLNKLNETVSMANQLASEALQKAQATLRVHQNTTSALLELEANTVILVAKASRTLASARNLATSNNNTKTTVAKLQEKLVQLTEYAIDYTAIRSRTSAAQSMTSSLQSQVTAESNLFSPSNIKALETVSIAGELTNQTQALGFQASDWLMRSKSAEQRSLVIQNEAKTLYDSALTTLETVGNFTALAAEVQEKANTSLSQVTSVAELSQQLIEQSENLTAALVSLKQNASAAKETAQQALQIIQGKQQRLMNLSNQADALQARLTTIEDVSGQRYPTLNNTRVNILTPAQERCQSLNASVNDFRAQLTEAESTSAETLQQAANVTQRANELLALLRSAGSLDTAAIEALLEQVRTAQSSVDVDALRVTISGLQTNKNVQRAEIDRLKSVRDQLKERIQTLKALQQQNAGTA